jgi:hypothetical protein
MRSDEVNPSSIRQLTKYRHTLRSTSFAEKNSYMAENNGAAILPVCSFTASLFFWPVVPLKFL